MPTYLEPDGYTMPYKATRAQYMLLREKEDIISERYLSQQAIESDGGQSPQ